MSEVNYDVLMRPFPQQAIKQRRGANGVALSYVEAHTVIRRLVEATGNEFDFRVLGIDIQDNLVMATVELAIGNSKRQQVGTVRMNGGNNDDAVKAAISDGLKKAATLFSVGLELYGPDYEAQLTQPGPAARPAQTTPVQAKPQGNGGNGNGNGQRRAAFSPIQRG